MLLLYDLTIDLNSSTDYRRLSILLSLLTLISLYVATLPASLWLILSFGVLIALWPILKMSKPHPKLQQVALHEKQWILRFCDGSSVRYERLKICVDTGFFLGLHFSGINKPRLIAVFYDQISLDELRQLNRLYAIL